MSRPTVRSAGHALASDVVGALKLTLTASAPKLLHAWISVPAGLLLMLLACFGVDAAFRVAGTSFPPSVACLVLLLGGLLLAEAVLGSHRAKRIVAVIEIPAGWALSWMGLFFTPSFVLLPLSDPIGVAEVFKIIGVFLIGFFITMGVVAYMVRALQLVLGSSKRAQVQRAEELDSAAVQEQEQIPLAQVSLPASGTGTPEGGTPGASLSPADTPAPSRPQTPPQLRIQHHHHAAGHGDDNPGSGSIAPSLAAQSPVPPTRAERWGVTLTTHLDSVTYTALLLAAGIPVFYVTGYAMPLHLCINVLAYMAATTLVPPSWRTYLHPILTSSLVTVLVIWAFSATRGVSLDDALGQYRTGNKYIQLWRESTSAAASPAARPGAGDLMATLLDASIVSLALPCYQHRRELRARLVLLLVPSLLVSLASLFVYPPLGAAIAIRPVLALAFVPRSLTLALATPAAENLGADTRATAAIAIVSGILGVICGQRLLAMLRIPQDDYVTRGITLGINSSAMATAFLLKTDPRAAALSCLSMVLFGTITVVLTAIPAIAALIRSLVGL